MRHEIATTKELKMLIGGVEDLINRPYGVDGCGVLSGDPGVGKTTGIAYVANKYDAIYIRAMATWTVTSMLGELCKELGGHRMCRRSDMVDYICRVMGEKPRPIFIDEADYLFRHIDMMDSIRDIYDTSGSPVVLIGMEEMARKIQQHGRFARRITQWMEFTGLDLEDLKLVAKTRCEVGVKDDLMEYLFAEGQGNVGRSIVGLSRIETFAKSNGLTSVDRATWGNRPLFYDQPVFGKGRKRSIA